MLERNPHAIHSAKKRAQHFHLRSSANVLYKHVLNTKTNLRNFLSETAELLRNNYNFIHHDTRSAEDLKIMRNFCKSKVNCIGFAGGGVRMPSWMFGVFGSTIIVTLTNHDVCIVMCLTSFQSNRHAIRIATCRTQFHRKKLRMFSRWIWRIPPSVQPPTAELL